MINIIGQAVCGIWTILGTHIPYEINHSFGSLMTGAWFGYVTLLHVIAFNRFIEICCNPYYKHLLFSGRAVNCWLAFCWLFAASWGSLMMMPQAGFMYSRASLSWYFDMSTEWSSQILTANWLLDIVLLQGSVLWYVAILIKLRLQISGAVVPVSTEAQSRSRPTEAQKRMREKERNVLRQAAFIGVYPLIWVQYWNVAGRLYANGFSYAYALGNVLWLSNHAVNPIVYVTMNKTIRLKVKAMLGIKPGNKVAQAPFPKEEL